MTVTLIIRWVLTLSTVFVYGVIIRECIGRRRSFGDCNKCGFDLRESPNQCPECGCPVPKTQVQQRKHHIYRALIAFVVAVPLSILAFALWQSTKFVHWIPTNVLARVAPLVTDEDPPKDALASAMRIELFNRMTTRGGLAMTESQVILSRWLSEQIDRGTMITARREWPRQFPLCIRVNLESLASPIDATLVLESMAGKSLYVEAIHKADIYPFTPRIRVEWTDVSVPIDTKLVNNNILHLKAILFTGLPDVGSADDVANTVCAIVFSVPVKLVSTTAQCITPVCDHKLDNILRNGLKSALIDYRGCKYLRLSLPVDVWPADVALACEVVLRVDGQRMWQSELWFLFEDKEDLWAYNMPMYMTDDIAKKCETGTITALISASPNMALRAFEYSKFWDGQVEVSVTKGTSLYTDPTN